MKEAVIMTREEYKRFYDSFQELKDKLENAQIDNMVLQDMLACAEQRINNLWDILNRPAIESRAMRHEEEFLDWCEEKNIEYERKEFDDWVTKRARFYNNGHYEFCKTHHISESEYDLYQKYDGWHPVVTELETEGWTSFWATHWHTDSLLWWAARDYVSDGRWDWDTYTLWLNQSHEALALGYEQH